MRTLIAFIVLVSLYAFPASASDLNRTAYWENLVQLLSSTLIGVFFIASIAILIMSGYYYFKNVANPQSFAQTTNLQPMTAGKLLVALALAGAMFAPLHTINLFADLAGFSRGTGMPVCSAIDVSGAHFNWESAASDCTAKAEENMARLIGFSESERINALPTMLLLKSIQFISLLFFFGAGIQAAKHLWGVKDAKGSVWMCFGAMLASSIMFALPNAVYYIDDFRGNENVILDPAG